MAGAADGWVRPTTRSSQDVRTNAYCLSAPHPPPRGPHLGPWLGHKVCIMHKRTQRPKWSYPCGYITLPYIIAGCVDWKCNAWLVPTSSGPEYYLDMQNPYLFFSVSRVTCLISAREKWHSQQRGEKERTTELATYSEGRTPSFTRLTLAGSAPIWSVLIDIRSRWVAIWFYIST